MWSRFLFVQLNQSDEVARTEHRNDYRLATTSQNCAPSVLIYRSFWLFLIHNFCYVSRQYRISKCIAKAMYLEKPKRPIIWDRGWYYLVYDAQRHHTCLSKMKRSKSIPAHVTSAFRRRMKRGSTGIWTLFLYKNTKKIIIFPWHAKK